MDSSALVRWSPASPPGVQDMAAWRRAAAELRPPRAGLTPSRAPAALYPVEEHAEDERGGEVGGRVQRVPEGEGGEDLTMGRVGVG